MFCGQLQCTAGEEKPYFVDYGRQYQQILLNDKIFRLVASLCVTAPDGFLLFCLVGIWFCFFKIKDVLFVLKTEQIPEKRDMKFFPEKSFHEKKTKIVCIKKWQIIWKRKEKLFQKWNIFKKERRNCSKKEKRSCWKKERRHC